MSLTIRTATDDDEASLMTLSERMANFPVPPWRSAQEITHADGRSMVNAVALAHPDSEVFLAERDGEVIGCLHMVLAHDFFGRRHAHISVIAVSAKVEGTGTGRALMEYAEGWARARQLPIITLNVFASNARARRLYEKAGFEVELLKYAKPL